MNLRQLAVANRLGAHLPRDVDLDAGVDAGHLVVATQLDQVVDDAARLQVDARVVVEKAVQVRRAQGKGAHGLPGEPRFAPASDGS